jgi:integrase
LSGPSRIKFFTRLELKGILSVARQVSVRDYAMILLGYRHGMRPTEVCRLELAHLDLDGGHILVVRLKNSVTTWQRLQQDEVDALRSWLEVRPGSDCETVFCSVRGQPLDRADFYVNLRKIAVKAGIPPERCRPHALKHSLAVHMGEASIPVQIIQRRLGHRSIQNTMIYLSIADGLVDQAVEDAAASGFVV